MKAKYLAAFLGLFLLLGVPALTPMAHAVPSGLLGGYWKSTFFGSALPVDQSTCITESETVPATPSTLPSASTVDPTISFGASTGFLWQETGFSVNSVSFHLVQFSAEWTGFITLPAGTTTFQLPSDDGSWLYIDGVQVINNGGVHGPSSGSGSVTEATSGIHQIEVDYYETCDSQSGIDLMWQSPSGGFVIVPSNVLCPAGIGSNSALSTSYPASACLPRVGAPEFPFGMVLLMAVSIPAMLLLKKSVLHS